MKRLEDLVGKRSLKDIVKSLYSPESPEMTEPNQDGESGSDGYTPRAGDEKKFAAVHKVAKYKDRNGNDSKLFNASNVKNSSDKRHGYDSPPKGDDKKAEFKIRSEEEQLDELTGKGKLPQIADKLRSQQDDLEGKLKNTQRNKGNTPKSKQYWSRSNAVASQRKRAEGLMKKGLGDLKNHWKEDTDPTLNKDEKAAKEREINAKFVAAQNKGYGEKKNKIADVGKSPGKPIEPESEYMGVDGLKKEDVFLETSPPSPSLEKWIKANKKRFMSQYGSEKGLSILYSKAWKRFKKAEDCSYLDEACPVKPDDEWIQQKKRDMYDMAHALTNQMPKYKKGIGKIVDGKSDWEKTCNANYKKLVDLYIKAYPYAKCYFYHED